MFHSFVRPNDRGKEVLSSVVCVDPGNNKEGWKIEKMYSDVLVLDQRMRNSVGKKGSGWKPPEQHISMFIAYLYPVYILMLACQEHLRLTRCTRLPPRYRAHRQPFKSIHGWSD